MTTVGIVVRDQYGRIGIVVEPSPIPSPEWIAEQTHLMLRGSPDATTWGKVLPLTGGLVIAPEPALEAMREATYEDFLTAVNHANVYGRRLLAAVFPEFLETAARGLEKKHD